MSIRERAWPSDPTLRDLIDRFPLAVAIAGHDGVDKIVNERFSRSFDHACLESEGIGQLLAHPSETWQPIRLAHRDGQKVDARAQAIRIRQGIMLVVDDFRDLGFNPAFEALHTRIDELEKRSATDGLTGVWNRGHLDRIIDSELSRSRRSRQPVSLILLDVDHFKHVNDSLGHLAGDSVLRELVRVIAAHIRASDSLYRWGGEEFVVLATATGHRAGEPLAEKLRAAVEQHSFAQGGSITVSIGVAEYLAPENVEGWFGRADTALYAAKNGGRNQVSVDRRGSSDLWAAEHCSSVLQLTWQEAYECGEPAIDQAHRELFRLANSLMAATMATKNDPGFFKAALDALLEHIVQHFADEEALLALHGYARLQSHKLAHAGLLRRAIELQASARAGNASLGTLVDFLANAVVAQHLFKADREFFPLFRPAARPGAAKAGVSAARLSASVC